MCNSICFSSKSFGSFDPRLGEFTRAGELATFPVPGASCHFSAALCLRIPRPQVHHEANQEEQDEDEKTDSGNLSCCKSHNPLRGRRGFFVVQEKDAPPSHRLTMHTLMACPRLRCKISRYSALRRSLHKRDGLRASRHEAAGSGRMGVRPGAVESWLKARDRTSKRRISIGVSL